MRRMFFTILLVGTTAAGFHLERVRSQAEPSQITRFPAAKLSRDGDQWLEWDSSRRLGYIQGYREGSRQGHSDGCGAAMEIFLKPGPVEEPANPQARCLQARMELSETESFYARQITDYYARFPSGREIPLSIILWLLSDSMQKTPEEIQQCYSNGPIGECKPSASKPAWPDQP